MLHRRAFIFALMALSILFTLGTTNAWAQNKKSDPFALNGEEEETKAIWSYDEKYRPEAFKKEERSQNLISNAQFSVHFIRPAGLAPDEAVLRFSQPIATSGCVKIVMPPPEIMRQGPMMWVTIGAPIMEMDQKPHYDHAGCAGKSNVAQTDLTLNRTDLLANKVKQITFRNDYGMDDYKVQINGNKLSLIPKTTTLFSPNTQIRNRDVLSHWFYPSDTIILSAPQATDKGATYEQIKKLAMAKGLIPLQSLVKGFDQTQMQSRGFYFSDPGAHLIKDLDRNKGIVIGAIKESEPFYSPNGPQEAFKKLDVYAKLPGLLE